MDLNVSSAAGAHGTSEAHMSPTRIGKGNGHSYATSGAPDPRVENAVGKAQSNEGIQKKPPSLGEHLFSILVSFGEAVTKMVSTAMTIVNLWKTREGGNKVVQNPSNAATEVESPDAIFVNKFRQIRGHINDLETCIKRYVNPTLVTMDSGKYGHVPGDKGWADAVNNLKASLSEFLSNKNDFPKRWLEQLMDSYNQLKFDGLPHELKTMSNFLELQSLAKAFYEKPEDLSYLKGIDGDNLQAAKAKAEVKKAEALNPAEKSVNDQLQVLITKLQGIAASINPVLKRHLNLLEIERIPETPEFTSTLQEIKKLLNENPDVPLLEKFDKMIKGVSCSPEGDKDAFERIKEQLSGRISKKS